MKFNDMGQEIPDPKPLEVPAHLRGAESTDDRIQRLISQAMSRHAQEQGFESIDEANDFDIDDDDPDEVFTQHEVMAMSLEVPHDGEGRDATHDAGHRARILNERIRRAARGSRNGDKPDAEDRPRGAQSRNGGQPGDGESQPSGGKDAASRAGRSDPGD